MPRTLLYVAYPMRLDLGAANGIQTYKTVQELQKLIPDMRLVVPRWLREPSAFADLQALHLPRPAVNKLTRIVPWGGWSYIERTLYAWMLVLLLVGWRLTRRSYRVLYARDAVCAAWLASLKSLHGAKVVYEVHDLEASHPSKASRWPRTFWRRFLPALDRWALLRSDYLVSLTETFRNWAVRKGIRRMDEIRVIPDAYDPSVQARVGKDEARRELGLPLDAYVVGYTGLTFAYRRLDLLVQAFAALSRELVNPYLALVGGRPDEVAELRALAEGLGISAAHVVTPGQVSQRRAALYLSASDALVIPDTVTGLTASPLKLFEYMAAGKPIVCKEMPALREILHNEAALYFPPGDTQALSGALGQLAREPELARRIATEAFRLSEKYTYAARAEKIRLVVLGCL